MLTVDCRGHNGGIALVWRYQGEVTISSYSQHHIDSLITIKGWTTYRLTGINGEPDRAKRIVTWDLIAA